LPPRRPTTVFLRGKKSKLCKKIILILKKLMKGKLKDISKGKVSVDYKMIFPG